MDPHFIEFRSGIEGLDGFSLPPYFTMLTIGFILSIFLAYRWAGHHGMDKGRMIDFGIWMVLWGLIGSKILHIIADGHFWDYVNVCFDSSKVDWNVDARECAALEGVWDMSRSVCHPSQTNCLAWLSSGGFAYYGGFIAAALFGIYFFKRHKWPVARMCDMGGWAISLGLVWGRMGCFLAGCCFGAPTDSTLAVVFPPSSAASRAQWKAGLLETYRLDSLPVYPTQVYESAAALIIAAIAYFIVRPRKRFDGQVFVTAMIMYAAARFLLEFIRNDERGALIGLSTSQWIAIGITGLCIWLWFHFKRAGARR